MFRRFGALVLAACLGSAGLTVAAGAENRAALPKGTASGVEQAQSWHGHNHLLWLVGGGAVIGGVVLVATGNGHGAISQCVLPGCTPPTTTTTTSTSTSTSTSTTTSTGP